MGRIEKRKIRKKRVIRKTFLIIVIFFISLVGTGLYIGFKSYHAANKSFNDLGREKSDLREEKVTIKDDPVSILLLGVEDYSSGGQNGRTDTIIVATFNPNDKKLKLLSIPRDTLVDIADLGRKDKITHAHVFGGKEMTIKTVEELLDIPIDYYASVDFEAFENIVNILDNVTVDVPFDFTQDGTNGKTIIFKQGLMELNGTEALAYVRMRKQDPMGDIGRNERQQQVIEAIIDKVVSLGTVTKIDDLAKEIGNNVETNMKISEGISFLLGNSNFNTNQIDKLTLETYSQKIDRVSYQIIVEDSLDEVKSILKDHLEIDTSINSSQLKNPKPE